MMRLLAIATACAYTVGASAQDAATTAPPSVAVNTSLLQVTLNLVLVLAAIVVLAWLFKRVQGFGQPAAGQLRVTATLPLGPKERLLLLDIGGEQILVGASAAGLSTLHVLAEPIDTAQDATPATFKDKLAAALSKSTQ